METIKTLNEITQLDERNVYFDVHGVKNFWKHRNIWQGCLVRY